MRNARPTALLVLLVLAVGISYIDRGSLAVAKQGVGQALVKPDARQTTAPDGEQATSSGEKTPALDEVRMGLLFSAFLWSYGLCQIAAGWFVDRYDVKWVYAAGFLIWSVATLSMGVVRSFEAFFAMRLLLGVGESVTFPATSRVIVENFTERRRGLANALVDAGAKIGPALSVLLGGLIVARWGWRAMFFITGAASLAWLVPWIVFAPSGRGDIRDAAEEAPRVGFSHLLVRREFWGTSLGFFCLGYTWYFMIFSLPPYLREGRHFSENAMAVFGSLPFWAMAAVSVTGGWTSDRWIAGGASPTLIRKGFLIAGFLLSAGFLSVAPLLTRDMVCVAFLTAACASLGLYSSNAWAVTQTLAGPRAAGQWSGLKNAIGNLGGAVSPIVTGWIVGRTGSYNNAFAVAALMLVVGVFAYLLLIPRIEPLAWDGEEAVGIGDE